MSQGVMGFVAQRTIIPPSATARREIAAGLRVKQPPQRNQSHDSSRNTSSPNPDTGQKHLGPVKNEQGQVGSQRGASGGTQFSRGSNGAEIRHETRGDFHERNDQADAQGGAFDTDVSEDFDRSVSDVQAPNSQRGFREQNVVGHQGGGGSQGDGRLLEVDGDSSGSESDDGDEAYARDPDETITIDESFQKEQAAFKVPVRTKPEGQPPARARGQRDGGNPRSRMLEELGSYPISKLDSPLHAEETQYADTVERQLGGQILPLRKDAHRTRVQWSEGPGSYYGSSDEEGEHSATGISRIPGLTSRRTTPGPRIKERTCEDQLDFPPTALAAMAYDQLQSEPFDTGPNAPPFDLPLDLTTAPLSSQLRHISTLPDPQRHQFFNSLDLDAWEDCGEWFVEQFAGVVKKMTALRREKRKVAMAFEEEVAERQEKVRLKTDGLRTVMGNMQREGKVLIEEKIA
ncbi:MAG: hypothetical protein M1839_000320 [Geoglossum umbratile]|nr:MAG: hypothetical protein M1839_000320 [Geoglossum umbratile]